MACRAEARRAKAGASPGTRTLTARLKRPPLCCSSSRCEMNWCGNRELHPDELLGRQPCSCSTSLPQSLFVAADVRRLELPPCGQSESPHVASYKVKMARRAVARRAKAGIPCGNRTRLCGFADRRLNCPAHGMQSRRRGRKPSPPPALVFTSPRRPCPPPARPCRS